MKTKLSLLYIFLIARLIPASAQVAPQAGRIAATPVAVPAMIKNTSLSAVRTWEPGMPTSDESAVMDSNRALVEVKQTTRYLDGLGRPIQIVVKKLSPSGKDMVTPTIYDGYGREQYKYLPYIQQTDNTSDGNLKANPFAAQAAFFQNASLSPGTANDHVFYNETVYEASPLNRVLKTFAPGDSWASTGGNHYVESQYFYNTTDDSVRIWNIAISESNCGGSAYYRTISDTVPVTTATYEPGQLYKNVTIDEAGNKTIEYKDRDEHVVLKKIQFSTTPGNAHVGWLCTYFVYDDLGDLRFVIPPMAVQLIMNSWNVSTVSDELCYQYKYDARGRNVMKKIPGMGKKYMVYDSRNRLVFSQDNFLRSQSSPQWLVNFYDGLNRPTMTGLYNSGSTQDVLQCSMDSVQEGTVASVLYTFPEKADLYVDSNNGDTIYQATNSITFEGEFDSNGTDFFEASITSTGNSGTTSLVATNPLPGISSAALTPLTYTYYDDYNYAGALSYQSSNMSKLDAGDNPYAETPSGFSARINTLATGTKNRILGTDTWLTSTNFYDDKGRTIQMVAENVLGGKDISSNLYDHTNKLLSNYVFHTNPLSAATPKTTLLTKTSYDGAGRVLSLEKKLNDTTIYDKVTSASSYDELGVLHQERIGITDDGGQLDTLTYANNIRGWNLGVNNAFVNNNTSGNWFGEEINYDNGFSTNQYNSNISGVKWKALSNGIARAYGYTYDRTNRLVKADFNQQNTAGATWTADKADFTVNTISYDANGNIDTLKQQGLIGNKSGTVDYLTYKYQAGSNKLMAVSDSSKTTTANLGDFNDGTNTGNDYTYDGNGNLTSDQNKGISVISYNYLNLPENIAIKGKGVISFLYDAAGNKLRKTIVDSTVSPVVTVVYDYDGLFLYKRDTLQYVSHEDGRIRAVYDSAKPVTFTFDYFERDRLGDVRVVLGTQTDTSVYAATMETAAGTVENALFSNIDNTRTALPSGYPSDLTTNPNSYVARVNAVNGEKIGPSIVLRVMAGDTIQLGVKAFYKSTGTNTSDATAENMLTALLKAFSNSSVTDGSHASSGTNSAIAGNFTSDDYEAIKDQDPTQNLSDKPKAYLNYALFDDQFNMVNENSGVRQVQGSPDELQTLTVNRAVIKKTGFLYIYTSNESGEDVYFDNLVVVHNSGPLLEETHYYPFGLTMAGISSSALKGAGYFENRLKYNGKEQQHKEFSDGSGLEWYSYGARMYESQIGRWNVIDEKSEKGFNYSTYNYALNNPVKLIDPDGKSAQDIIFVGSNKKELRIRAGGSDMRMNIPFAIKENKTIDIGLKNINPNNFAYGYTKALDGSAAAGLGYNYGVEASVVNFSNPSYSNYNYVYVGQHMSASAGGQIGISGSAGVSIFVAYYHDSKNSQADGDPGAFAGASTSVSASADLKNIVGGGLSVSLMKPAMDGDGALAPSGWWGLSIGLTIGIGESMNAGSLGHSWGNTTMMNQQIPTKNRSFIDRAANAVAPISTSLLQYGMNNFNH